jgi:hypothetical protein
LEKVEPNKKRSGAKQIRGLPFGRGPPKGLVENKTFGSTFSKGGFLKSDFIFGRGFTPVKFINEYFLQFSFHVHFITFGMVQQFFRHSNEPSAPLEVCLPLEEYIIKTLDQGPIIFDKSFSANVIIALVNISIIISVVVYTVIFVKIRPVSNQTDAFDLICVIVHFNNKYKCVV